MIQLALIIIAAFATEVCAFGYTRYNAREDDKMTLLFSALSAVIGWYLFYAVVTYDIRYWPIPAVTEILATAVMARVTKRRK
jgi:hypothetical protein